ncbi:helix-turn-helix domain-containing protein [Alteriqipengyuania lutimaris]|uniref:HTH marR-type domain-containing protein n=1 Tax=Alteriqipengyuania lutimaris TaxID=1538146 RepID=A0A395LJM3_9SPHN|nr:hypothetical protein [Alteriqipengyuania lutimaris]MBB3034080.1 hypothetical protein [Alteriqipengyuania lutimaris]RDS76981.1 hypothetical protein DL238_04745 [Alteriqipengyuania lutimaris]
MEATELVTFGPGREEDRASLLALALIKECCRTIKEREAVPLTSSAPDRGGQYDLSALRLLARSEYRRRRWRARLFDGYRFDNEPGWDILLDLLASAGVDGCLRTTSACIGSAAPSTTALRHLGLLEEAGLIQFMPDRSDARARLVRMTPKALSHMRAYFSIESV